jgi:hypothetical protein
MEHDGHNDDIVTAPIFAEHARIAFGSINLKPGDRGEIILAPDRPMHEPVLFMSDRGLDVIVEDIYRGHIAIAHDGHWPVALFRFGLKMDHITITKDEFIKIIIRNGGKDIAAVGASLVVDDRIKEPNHGT